MGKSKKFGLAFLLGVGAGWVASLFLGDDERKKQRQFIEEKVAHVKRVIEDPEEQERIKEIFGKKSAEAQATFSAAKDQLADSLSSMVETFEGIDKKKYAKAVDEAISHLKESQQVPEKQLAKLKNYLVADFENVKNRVKKEKEAMKETV